METSFVGTIPPLKSTYNLDMTFGDDKKFLLLWSEPFESGFIKSFIANLRERGWWQRSARPEDYKLNSEVELSRFDTSTKAAKAMSKMFFETEEYPHFVQAVMGANLRSQVDRAFVFGQPAAFSKEVQVLGYFGIRTLFAQSVSHVNTSLLKEFLEG